jgi:hypothetical protein
MPVHLAVMVFQTSRDTYHGTYFSEAPSRLPHFFSSKHLAFLDLPTELHDQIYKHLRMLPNVVNTMTQGPGLEITKPGRLARLPKMLPYMRTNVLSNSLVELEHIALQYILHQWRSKSDCPQGTKAFLPPSRRPSPRRN